MGMSWLKGLVGEPAQFVPAGQPIPGGMPGGAVWSAPAPGASGSAPADARIAALEAQTAQLRKDNEAIALFARTLLTVMIDCKLLTEEEFRATKEKIDLIDGKLDEKG